VADQLRRSKTDRVIAGVCGGIAEHFALDPTLVRILWVIASLLFGTGLLIYVILWIALPDGEPRTPALRIAEERFARGEITADELRNIREDLRKLP
jgi:phage shock protein C